MSDLLELTDSSHIEGNTFYVVYDGMGKFRWTFYTKSEPYLTNTEGFIGCKRIDLWYREDYQDVWSSYDGWLYDNGNFRNDTLFRVKDSTKLKEVYNGIRMIMPNFTYRFYMDKLPDKLCGCGTLMLQYKMEQYCPKCSD